MSPYLSVVIPVYNESENIRKNLSRVFEFLKSKDFSTELIVVDDGSVDQTVAIIEEFFSDRENFRLIKNPHKGKGFAVRTGVLAAAGQFILFADADLATPIEEVDRLLMWLREHEFDIAIASREGFGARRVGEPWRRHFLGRGFNFLVQLLVLPGIEDSQCGFKLLDQEAAREIFGRLKTYGEDVPEQKKAYLGAFDVEVLFIARKLGFRIKEVPITWTYAPTKRLRPFTDSAKMAWDVFKVRLNDWKGLYEK